MRKTSHLRVADKTGGRGSLSGFSGLLAEQYRQCETVAKRRYEAEKGATCAQPVEDKRILVRITGPRSLAALESYEEAEIAVRALRRVLSLWEGRINLAKTEVQQFLVEEEPELEQGGSWTIEPDRRLVLRSTSQSPDREVCRQVVASTKALADMDGEKLSGIAAGDIPAEFCQTVSGVDVKVMLADLAKFILETEPGKRADFLRRFCEEGRMAKEVQEDPDMPQIVRFVAQCAAELAK